METYLRVQSERPLIIRTGPGLTYAKGNLGTLAHGTVLIMEEKRGSWVKHYKGWSKWSEGAFAYYTPQYCSGSRRRSANTRTRRTPSPQKGYIARLDDRGFGFIEADRDGADIFFHCSSVVGVTFDDLRVNDPVEYSSELDGQRGKPRAVKVTKLSTRSRSERKPKPAAKPATSKSKTGSKFRGSIGQKVQCRDSSNQEWMTGTITSLRPTLVKAEGSSLGRQWEEVREWVPLCRTFISTRLAVPSSSASAYSTPATSESGSSMVSVNSYNWRTYVQTTPKYNQKVEKYVTLTQCVVQASVDPRSTKLFTLPENFEIQIDSVCEERARMISPYKGWLWMSSPRGPVVRSLDFHPRAYDNHVDFVSEHHVLRQPSRVTTTTVPCVIRETVNCQSAKLCTLPVGTSLTVESVYKQRAYVHANLNGGDVSGWCWLASPSGALVKLSPVKPTVVLTGPSEWVNDDDIQTTRNCLAVYGIQIVNITPLDTMTVELEVSSHRDGKIALKQLCEVNGKPVKLAWKKSYLAYREESASTRV